MFVHYETSKSSGYRHEIVDNKAEKADFLLALDSHISYQTVLGFGGAFTEASAYTLSRMSVRKRTHVLNAYFDSKQGLRYNLGRVAIHSCDFALSNYTYVDDNDDTLESFSIERDHRYVIPMIKEAEEIRGDNIRLLASPWSPPAWMKTNHSMNHGGKLLPKYYDVWAQYYVKFLEAYHRAGLEVFALSVQNEPAAVQVWDSCIYTAEEERDFVKNHLGPALSSSAYSDTLLLIWDHNRDIIIERAKAVLDDPEAAKYVWGTGFHWYVSEAFENLSMLHNMYPDKHLLFTEGCVEGGVKLGAFETGERYIRNMIGDFSHYCEGYIDWNLVLDEQGGPNHVGNYCDAPIICDTNTDTIHFNTSYYAIAHFSRHVDVGAVRIKSVCDHPTLNQVAFKNPDNTLVVIIQNETEEDTTLSIKTDSFHKSVTIAKRSFSTLIIGGACDELL